MSNAEADDRVKVELAARPMSWTTPGRMFSNLNPKTLAHDPSSLVSSVLLIAGTTVGAGMLALPAVTFNAGFVASSAGLGAACAYAITTGLLVAEVNINVMRNRGGGGVSMVAMANDSFGPAGRNIVSAGFLVLHYCLLVAYISRAGETISNTTSLPQGVCSAAFAIGIGAVCYNLSPKQISEVNGSLVLLFIATFLALLGLVSAGVDTNNLNHADFNQVPPIFPILVLAFIYQNIVPIVVQDLECDPQRVRTAIVAGACLPLTMFLAWEAAILGSMPATSSCIVDPLVALQEANPTVIGPVISALSFLALVTSYIGFVLSISDFLADLMGSQAGARTIPTYFLTIVPALGMAVTHPDIFISALSIAATYGVMGLFGFLPAVMSWLQRYSPYGCEEDAVRVGGGSGIDVVPGGVARAPLVELVPGGKPVLCLVAGLAAGIIVTRAVDQLGSMSLGQLSS
eukprot:gene25958-11642_t